MRNASRAIWVSASLLLSACGASPTAATDDEANETTDRSSTYVGAQQEGSTPCGWVAMPGGGDEYIACPSRAVRSPISDPPAEERESAPPQDFKWPAPPGDPPPM
jgi:hypothetical protein